MLLNWALAEHMCGSTTGPCVEDRKEARADIHLCTYDTYFYKMNFLLTSLHAFVLLLSWCFLVVCLFIFRQLNLISHALLGSLMTLFHLHVFNCLLFSVCRKR